MRCCLLRAALSIVTLAVAAPRAADADSTAIEGLARAERAFAALSESSGMKQAFLAQLCEDGLLFRPAPVNGRESWRVRPDPQGTLRWAPEFAEVAADGDLGYTTGPWEFIPAPGATPVARGHFVSIWKRDDEGDWCVALDTGISHELSTPGVDSVEFRAGPVSGRPPAPRQRSGLIGLGLGLFRGGSGLGVGVETGPGAFNEQERALSHQAHTMMSEERALAFELRRMGAARAYPRHAAEAVRFYREGALPTVGVTPAIAVLEPLAREFEWRPYGRGLSSSLDLGYSYGLMERRAKGAAVGDTSAYLHLWRRNPEGDWRLALDIESPFPKR